MNGAEDREWWTKVSAEKPVPRWRIDRDAHIRDIEAEYHDTHHHLLEQPSGDETDQDGSTELRL